MTATDVAQVAAKRRRQNGKLLATLDAAVEEARQAARSKAKVNAGHELATEYL